ncbi:hypothetical protein LWI29_027224 [Acer saccharum]|uniref:Uncharacterized protein n=1 Tax=Acer saccharum TaxID=4024 RepID=A0AA39S094_ACESA|nr:hypothetical protein LWI29_027224 [Acer saccharum]
MKSLDSLREKAKSLKDDQERMFPYNALYANLPRFNTDTCMSWLSQASPSVTVLISYAHSSIGLATYETPHQIALPDSRAQATVLASSQSHVARNSVEPTMLQPPPMSTPTSAPNIGHPMCSKSESFCAPMGVETFMLRVGVFRCSHGGGDFCAPIGV